MGSVIGNPRHCDLRHNETVNSDIKPLFVTIRTKIALKIVS
jgi:hypothetical protein